VAGLGGSLELSSGKYRTSLTLAARPGTNLVASGVDAATDGLTSGVAAVTAGTATISYLKVDTLVRNG
jgi:hypothetical protein